MIKTGGIKLSIEECKHFFASLFDDISNPVCVLTFTKSIIFFNNSFRELFNKKINFTSSSVITDLFPGIDKEIGLIKNEKERSFISSVDNKFTNNSKEIQVQWKAKKSDLLLGEVDLIILTGKIVNTAKPDLMHYANLVLNAMPVAYYSCDVSDETKTIWINEKIKQMTGYEPEFFINSSTFWQERIHPEDYDRTINLYKSILQTKNIELIYRWKCSDSEYRWFLDKAVCLTDETGKPVEIFGIWMDISDKKYAESALEQSRFFIQKIVDTTPGILFVYDIENQKTVFHNYNKAEFLKYPIKQFSGLNFQEISAFIFPDDIKLLQELYNKIESNPDKVHRSDEFRMISKDGSYTWFELIITSFIRDSHTGKAKQLVGIMMDVTDRSKMKEALKESEFSYKNLFDTIDDAIYIHDSEGKFIDVNPGAEKMYGYSREEFLERTPAFLSAEGLNDNVDVKKVLYDAFNGIPQHFEFWGKRKSGEVFPKEVKLYKGNYFGRDVVIALTQDITERKKNEKRIKHQEEKLRRITDNMLDIIVETDSGGNIIYVSPSFEDTLGFKADQILGKNIATLVHSEDYKYIQYEFNTLLNEQKNIEISFRYLKADGNYIWLEAKGKSLLDEKDKVTGLVLAARDISERKISEEKIKSTLAEKNVLLREVHHRVKNNLQAMIYLIEIQNERIEDSRIKIFLEELQEQARTMSLVYEQLYQSDYLASVNMESYLSNLASNVVQAFGSGKKVSFSVLVKGVNLDVETAMPCGLITNELITNSLKYAFPDTFNGNPELKIKLEEEDNNYTLEISDNGIGLPKDLDWENSESLGLKLVNLWVNYQLLGKMKIDSVNGTKYRITFGKNER